jgi:hypothetical protein
MDKELEIQLQAIGEMGKGAYEAGFEAGKKAKEKEMLEEAEKDEARIEQLREK